MSEPEPDSRETLVLLDQVSEGDEAARERLLERHRAGLRSFVELRLDPESAGPRRRGRSRADCPLRG
ncbi:MAG: hypothetical protein HYS12_09240 [Planctomycetes bacterium]|nr:hypothetical protein [Planctomycetota bacterium]